MIARRHVRNSWAPLLMTIPLLTGCTADVPPDVRAQGNGAAAPCRRTAEGEAGDLALAKCLAAPELVPETRTASARTLVYIDRSGSMKGFLDPNYPTRLRTDYRSVIDRLVVGLQPSAGFSFGTALRPIDPTLATLGDRQFYSDADTKVEAVLAEIAKDTAAHATHIIVGDGRRGSANSGDAQFVKMRELADRWTSRGGAFVVATSLAPFQTVTGDPSGCRQTASAATGPQTCPLYAFGFIAPGDAMRVAGTLGGVFEHVFVWPSVTVPPGELTVVPTEAGRSDIRVERQWATAPKGTRIVRVRGDVATNTTLPARIGVRDTSTIDGRSYAAMLAGQRVAERLFSRGFTPDAADQPWRPVETRGTLVRPGEELTLGFVTRGKEGVPTMFRIDLVPTGDPSWLATFDAEDAHDVVRTYGLGRLFEGFRAQAGRGETDGGPRPIGRLFFVAH